MSEFQVTSYTPPPLLSIYVEIFKRMSRVCVVIPGIRMPSTHAKPERNPFTSNDFGSTFNFLQ